MAKLDEWTAEQAQEWADWVATRPEIVQDMCKKFPPNRLYRLSPNGNRVTIYSYSEDGTMTVSVTGEFNRVVFSRNVFGIKPEDLEECDLPDEGENLGDTSLEAGYTRDDVENILIPQLQKDMFGKN